MPSKDTTNYHLTIKTAEEIERIRKVISDEIGVDVNSVTKKQAEIALRIKASRGKVYQHELKKILLGLIK